MTEKEYWIFIDDSGNIELSSLDDFFVYAALIFNNYKDVEKFRKEYKELINKYFKYELKKYEGEVKGNQRINFKKRKLIYDLITITNCKLMAIFEEKKRSQKLHIIESNFNVSLNLIKQPSAKTRKEIKKIRKDDYGRHKSYLIGQLICLIVENIGIYEEYKINIIIDNENLLTPGVKYEKFEDYLKYEQKYLKKFNHNYKSRLEDSKNDYCLQGVDFLAHSIHRKYNERDNKFFKYINDRNQIIIKSFPYFKEKDINQELDKELENDKI